MLHWLHTGVPKTRAMRKWVENWVVTSHPDWQHLFDRSNPPALQVLVRASLKLSPKRGCTPKEAAGEDRGRVCERVQGGRRGKKERELGGKIKTGV